MDGCSAGSGRGASRRRECRRVHGAGIRVRATCGASDRYQSRCTRRVWGDPGLVCAPHRGFSPPQVIQWVCSSGPQRASERLHRETSPCPTHEEPQPSRTHGDHPPSHNNNNSTFPDRSTPPSVVPLCRSVSRVVGSGLLCLLSWGISLGLGLMRVSWSVIECRTDWAVLEM